MFLPDSRGASVSSIPAAPDYFAHGGPEMERRQTEWERQIETLDQKEMELHQTQLRLIRDQTATFIRDLQTLRQDVALLKSTHESKHSDIFETVEKERKDRHNAHANLHEKIAGLEGVIPEHREDAVTLRNIVHGVETSFNGQLRDFKIAVQRDMEERNSFAVRVERRINELVENISKHSQIHEEADRKIEHHRSISDQERDIVHGKIKELVSQQSDTLGKVQATVGKDKSERELHNATVGDRLERLERDIQNNLLRKTEKVESDLRELQHVVGSERRSSESQREALSEYSNRLESHRTSIAERIDYLEKVLGDSSLETQAARSKIDHLTAQQGSMQQQSASHSSMAERLHYLEQAFGESADKHEKDVLQAKAKFEQLSGKVGDQQSKLVQYSSISERMEYVEKLLGDSADRHIEELASAMAKLEHLDGRLISCERHVPTLHELQKAHSNLAVEAAAKQVHHATLSDRLDYLEKQIGDSVEKHASDLEFLKASHVKHDASHSKHIKDIDAIRSGQIHHAAFTERLNTLDRVISEAVEKHEGGIIDANAKAEQLHARLVFCEASSATVADVKKSIANISTDKSSIECQHASLKERVDFLESMLGDNADRHSKSLDSAHAKYEHLNGRLAMCERLGGVVGDIQKHHANIVSDASALEVGHTTLKDRIEQLERQMQDSFEKNTRELDMVKVSHAKQTDEVKAVKSTSAQHVAIQDRVAYLEKLLADSADAHVEELTAAHSKIDAMHGRVSTCERHGGVVGDLKKAHAGLASEKATLEQSVAAMNDRMERIEMWLGDSTDKHTRGLEESKSKFDLLHARMMACEKVGGAVSDLIKDHDEHRMKVDSHRISIRERLDYLERVVGESAETHTRELDAIKAAHARMANDSKAQQSKLNEACTVEKETREVHHATVQERLTFIEGILKDSAEKHERHIKEVDAQKQAHLKLSGEVKARELQHNSLQDAIARHEKRVAETAEKVSQEVDVAHTKIDHLHSRLSDERVVREGHATIIEHMKKAHTQISQDKITREEHHAIFNERLDHVEKVLGETVQKHVGEIETVKVIQSKLTNDAKARDVQHHALTERVAQVSREKEEAFVRHASLQEQVDYLHQGLNDRADKHEKEIENVRANHTKHAKEIDTVKKTHAKHAALHDRVEIMEQHVQDVTRKHAEELTSAQNKLDQVHAQLVEEKSQRERHHTAIGDSIQKEKKAREEHSTNVESNIRLLEEALSDHETKHSKDLDAHKTQHLKLVSEVKGKDSQHATFSERLAYVESLLHATTDRHAQDIAAAETKIGQLHSRVAEERAARETVHGSARQTVNKEKDAREEQIATLTSRVDHLEGSFGEHSEKQTRELETHKNENSKLVSGLKGHQTQHQTVVERLDTIDRDIATAVQSSVGAVQQVQNKLEMFQSRLATCEKYEQQIKDMQKTLGNVAGLHVQSATLKERIEYIEGVIVDTGDHHRKAIDQVMDHQHKHFTDTKAREVHLATMSERVNHLETLLHDAMGKHALELAEANNKVDQFHSRVASCEAHGQSIDSLRKSHTSMVGEKAALTAQSVSVSTKLAQLEQDMLEHREKHGQELKLAHHKIDHLAKTANAERTVRDDHARAVVDQLGKEQEARGVLHVSTEERLTYLESFLGESAELKSRDSHSYNGNLSQRVDVLEQRMNKEFGGVWEQVQTERLVRAQHHEAISSHLENEKDARDSHEKAVRLHLEGEKKGKEAHESFVAEQLSHEKQQRERHVQHFHEVVKQESQQREHLFKSQQEQIDREKATRHVLQELIEKESNERAQSNEQFNERFRHVQNTLEVFDNLVRKEISERAGEFKNLWDAVQKSRVANGTRKVTMETDPVMLAATASPAHSHSQPIACEPTSLAAPVRSSFMTPVRPHESLVPQAAPVLSGQVVGSGPFSLGTFAPTTSQPVTPMPPYPPGGMLVQPQLLVQAPEFLPGATRSRTFTSMAPAAATGQISDIFSALDSNNDGVITREEFGQLMLAPRPV